MACNGNSSTTDSAGLAEWWKMPLAFWLRSGEYSAIIAKTSTVDMVRASCVLHNYLRRRDGVSNDRRYIDADEVDRGDREGNLVCGPRRAQCEALGLRDAGRMAANTHTRAAAGAHDRFAEFFVSAQGWLPRQKAVVRRGVCE